jgi:PAS domain S-box-containing protein
MQEARLGVVITAGVLAISLAFALVVTYLDFVQFPLPPVAFILSALCAANLLLAVYAPKWADLTGSWLAYGVTHGVLLTVLLHFVGGLQLGMYVCVYVLIILHPEIARSRRPFLIANFCWLCYLALALYDYRFGQSRIFEQVLTLDRGEIAVLVIFALLLLNFTAIFSSRYGESLSRLIHSDQAARARAEAERRSRQQLEEVVRQGRELISTVDRQGRLVYVSPSHREVMGYAPEELVGRNVADLTHAEDLPRLAATLSLMPGDPPAPRHECRLMHKDGTWRTIEGTVTPLGPASLLRGDFLVNAWDNTERAEQEKKLRLVLGEIESRNKELDGVLGDLRRKHNELREITRRIVHDAKAPINNALLLARSLSDSLHRLDERAVRRKLKEMVHDCLIPAEELLLDLFREYAPVDLIRNEPVTEIDCEEVVPSVVALLQPQAMERGVEIRIISRLPVVTGRLWAVRSVFQNLIDNAIKYGPVSGGQVRVRATTDNNWAIFEVADNGPGIPENEREKIFERHYRLGEQRGHGGGNGLSIVRNCIGSMKGSVWVDCPQEGGSRFYIRLPLAAPASTSLA